MAQKKAQLQSQGGGRFVVKGDMNVDTAGDLWCVSGVQFEAFKHLSVDLSEVADVDSGAVALLLAWTRLAKRSGKTLDVHNAPASIRSVLAISDLTEIVALAD